MSEQGFYPKESASKRGSSLLRAGGPGVFSSPSPPNDQTVISSDPPMSSINVSPEELKSPFHVGDCLGVYELTEYIGGGGMGRVYKAFDTVLDRVVAVKILLPEAAGNEEAVLRFQNEARSAARLDHESIAKVFFVGEAEGLPYLVFEYVEGINLRDLVRQRGPIPLSDAIGIVLQLADSLSHASLHGVVHRDVKPSNILLRDDGQIKLIDFGLARIVEVEERDNDLTASGVTLGTFDYISPEQARDPRTVDIRSDIYSLGCTLFYMLTGRPPFPEGTVLQKLLQHQGDRPPNVREFRPELSEEIGLLLDRMMAKDPNDRFQTPFELREQIRLLAAQLGLRSLSFGTKNWTLPPVSPPSALSRHLPWLLPVTALLVIVLGLDFYWTRGVQLFGTSSGMNQTTITNVNEAESPFPEPPKTGSSNGTKVLPSPQTSVPTLPASQLRTPEVGGTPPSATATMPTTPAPSSPAQQPLFSEGSKTATTKEVTTTPPSGEQGDGLDWDNVQIQSSPSPHWGAPGEYKIGGLDESATYDLSSSATNGTPRFLTALAALEETLASKGLATNKTVTTDGNGNSNGNVNRTDRTAKNTPTTTPRYGILTVGEPTEGSVSFASLAAACRAAATGDIIELRYNGKQVEQPLVFSGKNLILRAAKGYQPSVVFRPNEPESVAPDPTLTHNTMISLGGGSLTAINVSFRLELDKTAPPDRWTLFETQSGESIQLQKCHLSVQNLSQQTATFFRVTASPSDGLAEGDSIVSVGPVPPAQIVLTDSIVRGNATFLTVDEERPVDCSWKNGLLVTDGTMLDLKGSEAIWNHKDRVSISLKHITAYAASGMCRLGDGRQGPPTIPVDYTCYDSVILVANTNAMITQWIDESSSDVESLFRFEGDRNYYQGFDYFLIQKNRSSEANLNQLDFTAWQNRWFPDYETYSLWGWFDFIETPDKSKPMDQRGPADYALSNNPENPIPYAADDGTNLGFLLEHLPTSGSVVESPVP